MEILLIFILFAGSIILVAQPLFKPVSKATKTIVIELKNLEDQKLALYHQIKQIELESELGLLTEEDYSSTRFRLKTEASGLIGQINELKKK
ncbi:MAG: hypothetical protein HQ528_04540 [Candidatus Marinimicrobia bacterium]|nr:hypothetical protein [Candidatus Neomarinimicrobiota bacterium]